MAQPKDTRTVLLEAALECFADFGFEGTSIRMIADRVGRPLSLISHHFGGKEGLYVEVFRHMLMDFHDRLALCAGLSQDAPSTQEEALVAFRGLVRFLYLDSAIKRRSGDPLMEWGAVLWLREFRAPRPTLREHIRTYLCPFMERMEACLALLCPGLSPEDRRFQSISILGAINGHSMMSGLIEVIWGEDCACRDPGADAERLADLCVRGLEGYQQ